MVVAVIIPLIALSISVVLYIFLKFYKKRNTDVSSPSEVSAYDLVDSWSMSKPVETVYSLPKKDKPVTAEAEYSDTTRLKKAFLGPVVHIVYNTLPKEFLRKYNTRVEVGFTRVVEHRGEIKVISPRFIGEDFIIFSVFAGIILCAVSVIISLYMGWSYMVTIGLLLFAPLFGFFSVFLLPYFRFEKRRDEIEEHLPDVLEQLSSMSGLKNMDEIIGYLAETKLGAVSEEFAIANHILMRNLNLETALRRIRERTESKTLSRVLKLLTEGAIRGVDVGDAARKMAESLRNRHEIIKERSASLSLQRYTLLAAASILVPLILGIVWGISTSLANFPTGTMAGMTFNAQKAQQLLKVVRNVFSIYVIIHAVEASFSVARQEGDIKRSVIYLLPLAVISYFVFDKTCNFASFLFAG